MRILLAFQDSPYDYPIPAYRFWLESMQNGLSEAGHTVLRVPEADWARGLLDLTPAERDAWLDATWSRTVRTVRDCDPDLFLTYCYPQQVSTGAVRDIQALGCPVVNFFCDHVRELRGVPDAFRPFTLHWVPEYHAQPWYRDQQLRCLHAPMPVWIPPELRDGPAERDGPAVFVGSYDELRGDLLFSARQRGAHFVVMGSGWTPPAISATSPFPRFATRPLRRAANQVAFVSRWGLRAGWRKLHERPPPDRRADMDDLVQIAPFNRHDYVRTLQRATVAIGINRVHVPTASWDEPPRYSRLRDIEAPMAGACLLTEDAPELPAWYDLDTEIWTYREAAELAEKLAQLNRDASLRTRLRHNGQRRALQTHSIACTVERIAEALGLRI